MKRDWVIAVALVWLLWPRRVEAEEVTTRITMPDDPLTPVMEGLCIDIFGRVDYCTRIPPELQVQDESNGGGSVGYDPSDAYERRLWQEYLREMGHGLE